MYKTSHVALSGWKEKVGVGIVKWTIVLKHWKYLADGGGSGNVLVAEWISAVILSGNPAPAMGSGAYTQELLLYKDQTTLL